MLLTGFSLGCIATIFIIVAREFWYLTVGKVFLALTVAASAFLLNQVVDPVWKPLTAGIMTMIPALFWLLCQTAFSRRPRIVSLWGGIALYSFLAPAISRSMVVSGELSDIFLLWGWQIPRYTEYLLILHGMWVVAANWSDDLIESRRQLRGVLLGTVGFTALWVTLSLNTGYGSRACLPLVVGIAALIIALVLLKGRTGVLLGAVNHPLMAKEPDDSDNIPSIFSVSATVDDAVVVPESARYKLKEVMEHGFYRTEKLTLKMLAKKIELPEYKARELINQTLGYRNFNDYINQLRIAEAGARLKNEPDTPVLNIALDVGYRTLSSFNRAFKEILEVTPTVYRQNSNEADTKTV